MISRKDSLIARAKILKSIRSFFDAEGFLEVETPSLVASPGMEATLEAFKTAFYAHAGAQQQIVYLPTSPEFHMKRLLTEGFSRIYQLARAFRNEEQGALHNPEFTILEWYRANSGYERIMIDCERLLYGIVQESTGCTHLMRRNRKIELTPPWPKKTMNEIWREYGEINLAESDSAEKLRKAGVGAGVCHLQEDDPWEILFFKIFLDRIEPHLGWQKPLIVTEYPACMSALARLKPGDPSVALRFELYVGGIELANAFDELTDPQEQRRRFEESRNQKLRMNREPYPADEKFLEALERGMPPSGGIALGVDRLIMLMLEAETIRDIMAFSFLE